MTRVTPHRVFESRIAAGDPALKNTMCNPSSTVTPVPPTARAALACDTTQPSRLGRVDEFRTDHEDRGSSLVSSSISRNIAIFS
eukprot:1193196-Prorocentrum_minimum.AAC.1